MASQVGWVVVEMARGWRACEREDGKSEHPIEKALWFAGSFLRRKRVVPCRRFFLFGRHLWRVPTLRGPHRRRPSLPSLSRAPTRKWKESPVFLMSRFVRCHVRYGHGRYGRYELEYRVCLASGSLASLVSLVVPVLLELSVWLDC